MSVIPEIIMLMVSINLYIYKTQITKELRKDIVCLVDIIYLIPYIIT